MISVNTIYQQCLTITNKYVGAGWFGVDTFNNLAAMVNMQIFNNEFKRFQNEQYITDELKIFIKNSMLMVDGNTNVAAYPSDYCYFVAMRGFYNKGDYIPLCEGTDEPDFTKMGEVKVRLVSNDKLADILSSEVYQPTNQYPIAVEYGVGWRLYPSTIGFISLDYLRQPSVPYLNTTIGVNGLPQYTASGSTDFEWGAISSNQIVYLICSSFGIQISSEELTKVTAGFSMNS